MKAAKLERKLSLLSATMIGIGGAIGTGVFVLTGRAAGMAGPAVIFSFILSALFALFTALNYSELAVSIPLVGGGYSFVRHAIGGFPAFLAGWFFWFGYMFYAALCVVGATYVIQFFAPFINPTITAVSLVLVFTAINFLGAEEAGRAGNLLTIILLVALFAFVLSGFIYGFKPQAFANWTPKGVLPIFTTVSYIYVCFMGFEIITTLSEEIHEPEKNLPRSIGLAFAISTIMYCLIVLVAVGVVGWDKLGESLTPLTMVAVRTMGDIGGTVISIASIFAIMSSLNASIIAATRMAYALSRDGYLPSDLSSIHKRFNTPHVAVILSIILITVFIVSGAVDFLAYASVFGFLVGDALVNCSVIWLRNKRPHLDRPFKVPFYPYVPLLGALSSVAILLMSHHTAIGIGLLWAVTGLLSYYVSMLRHTRVQFALGGIVIGVGITILTGALSILYGLIPPIVSPTLLIPFLLSLFFIGIVQIVTGFLIMTHDT